MRKAIIAMLAVVGVVSLSGCTSDWIGKGKGKAPPPVAEPAPVYK
ncbi:MAG TPA: ABC transporter [Rhizobiaceae bacterium]